MTNMALPTSLTGGNRTAFLSNIRRCLNEDSQGKEFIIVSYALTMDGWNLVRGVISSWMEKDPERKVIAYIGTNHGLTTPEALEQISNDANHAYHASPRSGCFHPKVFILKSPAGMSIWSGSNNLTKAGLSQNVEYGTRIEVPINDPATKQWLDQIHSFSQTIDASLISAYKAARTIFGKSHPPPQPFHWAPNNPGDGIAPPRNEEGVQFLEIGHRSGDLILEVMERETSTTGNQVTVPKGAAIGFFGAEWRRGARFRARFRMAGTTTWTAKEMEVYGNFTFRLTIPEMCVNDRPCLLTFRKVAANDFEYEIVRSSHINLRFNDLLRKCTEQTSIHSRRWGIAPNAD